MTQNLSMEPAIEAKGVNFTYQEGARALVDVNFSVKKGEFVALLASNGSGKTTLIKALVRLLKPQRGEVLINGANVAKLAARELYQQIGLVLQNPNDQLFSATVEQDVAFGPRNLDLAEDEVYRRVDEALKAVGCESLRERAIHHLSFGEQKRVCLAGALAMKPSILLLDEPMAGLDPAGESQMLHLLSDLNRRHGITIVLATHSVDMLPLFADRICVLKGGRVLKEGTPEEIFNDQDTVDRASLRLPYISALLRELKRLDGVPINGLPLTIREARYRLVELIPPNIIMKSFQNSSQ